MTSGFNVNIEALRSYSGKLAENKTAVGKVSGLVDEADVGDESWGVVGIFVKQSYTEMLSDLKNLMTEMENGLQSASDKISTAAQSYQDAEDGHQRSLSAISGEVEQATVKTIET
ncbi:WXG100 family type VII secretion target [Saccharomonospora saliphila]|uniref:WXG100 family type VII secretion target n=1 Tax=Saccharomonospora saliphila TaxID=369829 RepID=UPI00036134A5|nr:type VII secretion target [Saccharomonospora saliphila]